LVNHDLELRLIESLNKGLRSIDPFAKVHWVDTASSEYSTGVGDENNLGIELFDAGLRIIVVPLQGGYVYGQGFTEPGFLTSINYLAVGGFDFDMVWRLYSEPSKW